MIVIECLTLCNYVNNYVGYYFVIILLGLTLPIAIIYNIKKNREMLPVSLDIG